MSNAEHCRFRTEDICEILREISSKPEKPICTSPGISDHDCQTAIGFRNGTLSISQFDPIELGLVPPMGDID